MKKTLITFLSLSLLSFAIIFPSIIAQAQVIHTATYNVNNLSFHSISSAPDGNTYTKVLLSEISDNIAEPGKPKLPVHTLKLMIPFRQGGL